MHNKELGSTVVLVDERFCHQQLYPCPYCVASAHFGLREQGIPGVRTHPRAGTTRSLHSQALAQISKKTQAKDAYFASLPCLVLSIMQLKVKSNDICSLVKLPPKKYL